MTNITSIWEDACHKCIKTGDNLDSRVGACREIIGESLTLYNRDDHEADIELIRRPGVSPSYAAAELLWYLTRDSSVHLLKKYAPGYVKFCDDGEHAHGSYGARWREDFINRDQISTVLDLLTKSPNTRQAIISMWNRNDLSISCDGGSKDIPCTLNIQFLARDGFVDMIVNMRSNDLWLGFVYDVFCFRMIQVLISRCLGLKPGKYVHNVGSMHLYEKNITSFLKESDAPRFSIDSSMSESSAYLLLTKSELCERMMDDPHDFTTYIKILVQLLDMLKTRKQ